MDVERRRGAGGVGGNLKTSTEQAPPRPWASAGGEFCRQAPPFPFPALFENRPLKYFYLTLLNMVLQGITTWFKSQITHKDLNSEKSHPYPTPAHAAPIPLQWHLRVSCLYILSSPTLMAAHCNTNGYLPFSTSMSALKEPCHSFQGFKDFPVDPHGQVGRALILFQFSDTTHLVHLSFVCMQGYLHYKFWKWRLVDQR